MKEMMHKLCFVKNFCSTKDIKRLRRQATDGKKIYAKHTSIKDHYKNKYKQYLKLNNKEIARLKNRPKSLTDTSPKEMNKSQICKCKDTPGLCYQVNANSSNNEIPLIH